MLTLNWSPFLHISNDINFGSINTTNAARASSTGLMLKDGDRISLLSLEFGARKFYFVSLAIAAGKIRFQLFKCLRFYDVLKKYDIAHIDKKTLLYKNHIRRHTEEQRNIQIDFLKEKFNENQSRISGVHDKITNYSAIALVYIGFVGYLLTEILKIKSYSSGIFIASWIIFSILVIYTLNLICFIQLGLSVKSYVRSKFLDLKNAPTSIQLAANYYADWYSERNHADIISSIVSNIEFYYFRSLFVSFLLWLLILLNCNDLIKPPPSSVYENERLINRMANEVLINFPPRILENKDTTYINPIKYDDPREIKTKSQSKRKPKIPAKISNTKNISKKCKE